MGAMFDLAPNDGYEFGKTHRFNTRSRGDNWRTCIPHFFGGSLIKYPRGVPAIAWTTMVVVGAH